MKKYIYLLILPISYTGYAQVGINTDSPKTTLDVSAKRDDQGNIIENSETIGLQAPRLTRAELTENTASYNNNQTGALIYITDITGGDTLNQRININSIGYYYFDGTIWQRFANGEMATQEPWNIQGSSLPASANNHNIYQSGSVAIKKQIAKTDVDLDVQGSIRAAGAGRLTIGGTEPDTAGFYSVALGPNSEAEGNFSFSIGQGSKAFGSPSGAIGFEAETDDYAPYSLSIGNNTVAKGQESMALGFRTEATSQQETVLGRFNAIRNGNPTDVNIETDPILQVGNGTGIGTYTKNALTILKNGQIGINIPGQDNAAKPDPSAILDVQSTDKGFLPPRVILANNTVKLNSLNDNATGLLVFNNGGNNALAAGYYYWDGTKWVSLGNSGTNSDFQNLYTNDGTLEGNRIVNQDANSIAFTSNATTGNNQFSIDGSTFSVNTVDNRIGINITEPTNSLDVNGDLKIRSVDFSEYSTDVPLVIDSNGVVKKDVKSKPSNFFRGYSTRNYTSPSNYVPHTITGIRPIGTNLYYDTATGIFNVNTSGIYKITITATLQTTGSNLITGLINKATNQWITRSTFTPSNLSTGRAHTTVNIVRLTEGDIVSFGIGPSTTVIAVPGGGSGSGIGTFYEIEYLSEGDL